MQVLHILLKLGIKVTYSKLRATTNLFSVHMTLFYQQFEVLVYIFENPTTKYEGNNLVRREVQIESKPQFHSTLLS